MGKLEMSMRKLDLTSVGGSKLRLPWDGRWGNRGVGLIAETRRSSLQLLRSATGAEVQDEAAKPTPAKPS
jgi:hypothetical protein